MSVKAVKLKQLGHDKQFHTPDQLKAMARVAHLTSIYRDQYPGQLPDNEVGFKYARYMCRTLAFFQSVEHREKWLERYAPWMGDDDRAELAGTSAYWYSSRSLGQHLELYDEDRERLKAWMVEAVDVTPEQRKAINKEKHRKVQERARRESGARPHELSVSRTRQWEAEGFKCRRTWERHRKRAAEAAVSQKRDELLSLRNEKSRTCDTVPAAQPVYPKMDTWPYCAEHIVCRDDIYRRTLQDISGAKSRVPIADDFREAA